MSKELKNDALGLGKRRMTISNTWDVHGRVEVRQCCTCRYGVYNEEEPSGEWLNFDLDDGYWGQCYLHPPVRDGKRPEVIYSDFCGSWVAR